MTRVLQSFFLACGLIVALPPVAHLTLGSMFGQMLLQIPLVFGAATVLGYVLGSPSEAWQRWNLQGATGLLLATVIPTFWMIPVALDYAVSDPWWEASKVASLIVAGVATSLSWRVSSTVTRAFFLGNLLWMTATVGLLFQEFPERLCNAYLWDDQALTGEALVIGSGVIGVIWTLRLFHRLSAEKRSAGPIRAP
jgi:hypothetical protein